MIAIMARADVDDTENLLAVICEMLVDVRAQVYTAKPDLAELIRAAEHVADAVQQPEERREMEEILREYEQRFLQGRPRYTGLLTEHVEPRNQMHWDW